MTNAIKTFSSTCPVSGITSTAFVDGCSVRIREYFPSGNYLTGEWVVFATPAAALVAAKAVLR